MEKEETFRMTTQFLKTGFKVVAITRKGKLVSPLFGEIVYPFRTRVYRPHGWGALSVFTDLSYALQFYYALSRAFTEKLALYRCQYCPAEDQEYYCCFGKMPPEFLPPGSAFAEYVILVYKEPVHQIKKRIVLRPSIPSVADI